MHSNPTKVDVRSRYDNLSRGSINTAEIRLRKLGRLYEMLEVLNVYKIDKNRK